MTGRSVDIVVPVHNALQLTKRCLESITVNRETTRHRIIVVDDGSSTPTQRYLRSFVKANPGVDLLRSEQATGFTKAANRGLRHSLAEMVIVLNSDTEVPPRWIDKLERVMFATPGVGVVGPLSNAASYQSIPRQNPNEKERLTGQTVVNDLPSGMTLESVNEWLENNSPDTPLRVPMVHGFCYCIRRGVIDDIGYFDEELFPEGYGEEDDYSIRAVDAGWSLAVALDTYVWHEKSGSYSKDRRQVLVSEGRERFRHRHGQRRRENSLASLRASGEAILTWATDIGRFSAQVGPTAEALSGGSGEASTGEEGR